MSQGGLDRGGMEVWHMIVPCQAAIAPVIASSAAGMHMVEMGFSVAGCSCSF